MNLRTNYRALATIGIGAALAIAVGGGSAIAGAVAYARTAPTPVVTYVSESEATDYDYYSLPSCAEDAPDPSMTVACVWEDDGLYWVMDGIGHAEDFAACRTEDSDDCVWDAAERGNRSRSVDAPDRYIVSDAR